MILTRLLLNPASRRVQRCLADSQALHQFVMSLFESRASAPARKSLGVLHRLDVSEREGTFALLVQSRERPDPSRLPSHALDPRAGETAVSSTDLATLQTLVKEGAQFRFRLRANPTRKIDTKSAEDGARRLGRRVPLRGDGARLRWLVRRLEGGGLRVIRSEAGWLLTQRPGGTTTARRRGGDARHEIHVFEGVAEVVDPGQAWIAVTEGIGPAKAYGCGLLSLAPLSGR